MLRLPDRWIWDSWPVEKDGEHHLFFLQAPNDLDHHDLRHHRATVGHAITDDHENWTILPDALAPAAGPSWDDLAIWTGSVVQGPSGAWHLFYTAISRSEKGLVQRIGRADSDDLRHWRRYGQEPLLCADPRWYETLQTATWREEAWRDPWVYRDPDGDGWHMLITARSRHGAPESRGVIGHARSTDLTDWEVRPPLSRDGGFGHLEVPQVTEVQGRAVLTFCCTASDLSRQRRAATPCTGMWSAPASSLTGPFDVSRAEPFEDVSLYAAHVITTQAGQSALLGFTNMRGTTFVGAIPRPVPVHLTPRGTLAKGVGPASPASAMAADDAGLGPARGAGQSMRPDGMPAGGPGVVLHLGPALHDPSGADQEG